MKQRNKILKLIITALSITPLLCLANRINLNNSLIYEASAEVTNGKSRINFLTEEYWLTESAFDKNTFKTGFTATKPKFGSGGLGVYCNLPTGYTKTALNEFYTLINYLSGNTTWYFTSYEFDNISFFTYTGNSIIGRSAGEPNLDGINLTFSMLTMFNNNTHNTYKIEYKSNKWTATGDGWYNSICIHGTPEDKTILVKKGDSPTAPAKSGYAFVNWYTDSDLKNVWVPNIQTTDINLYAKYESQTVDKAKEFAKNFNNTFHPICEITKTSGYSDSLGTAWLTIKGTSTNCWGTLEDSDKTKVKTDTTDSDIVECKELYIYIVRKYNASHSNIDDFMGYFNGTIPPLSVQLTIFDSKNDQSSLIAIIISTTTLLFTTLGYYLIKKKKED